MFRYKFDRPKRISIGLPPPPRGTPYEEAIKSALEQYDSEVAMALSRHKSELDKVEANLKSRLSSAADLIGQGWI